METSCFNGLTLNKCMQRVAIVVVGVATLSLGFLGCSGSSSGAGGTLVTVEAQKPAVGPISQKITADAVLSPVSEAVISPKVTSPVRKFYVRRGSHVRVGQLLATLQNQDLSAAALDSEGQYEAEQAVYDSQTKAQFPEDYQKALLDVKQAKAQVTLNEKIVVSRQKLFSQGAIAGRELDTARAALVQANAAYDTALNHLRGMQSVSREESIKQAQGQLKSAKGKYLSAKAQLSFTDIRSPIRGIVTDRPLYAGEMANAGAPLITVMDTSALIAKVHLAEMVAQRLKLGDKAELEIPGITARVPAEVSLISPALDPGSTTIEVWLKVQNPRGQYKAGTPIHALIVGNTATNAMQVPISALLTGEDGSKSVMVVGPDSSAQKKPVTVGINDGKNVQITSGLKADEMVITSGAYGLDNGTKVRVGKPDDSGAVGGEGS